MLCWHSIKKENFRILVLESKSMWRFFYGLFSRILGRGADLRPGTDIVGEDKDAAGEDHGVARMSCLV